MSRARTLFFSKYQAFAIVACISMTFSDAASSYTLKEDRGRPLVQTKNVRELTNLSNGLADLAEEARKALVYISVSKARKSPQGYVDPFEYFFGQPQRPQGKPRKEGLGSGFFIDLKKGYVMTNNHVIEGADEIELKLANGKSYPAKLVGRDANTDIAVLQIEDKNFARKGITELVLSKDDPRVGEFAVALGAPFGLEASISFGVLSALGRNNLQITKLGNFIQTDAAINPGNSGGPLVSTQGKVIGINTAIYSKSGGYNGIGFAVPAKLARSVAQKLITDGKVYRGYIGVGLQVLTPEIAEGLGLKDGQKGALVKQVEKNGPAAKSGLKPGDVIVKIDDTTITSDSDLVLAIGTKSPGEKVSVEIYRDARKRTVKLTIGTWPGEQRSSNSTPKSSTDKMDAFGLFVKPLTNELQSMYGYTSSTGVVVTNVQPGSSADEKGVRRGDVIVAINRNPVQDIKTFNKAVKGQEKLLMRVERRGEFLFIALSKD